MRKLLISLVILSTACTSGAEPESERHSCLESTGEDTGSSSSSSGSAPIDDLQELSDDFEGLALDESWELYQPELASLVLSDGALVIEPEPQTLWYNNSTGFGIYKEIEGAFEMTATVTVSSIDGAEWPALAWWQLAGVQIRNVNTSQVQAAHLALGKVNQSFEQIEPKNTLGSVSQWSSTPWGEQETELRICRSGSAVVLSAAEVGQEFSVFGTYDRPELDDDVMAGFIAYANTPFANLRMVIGDVTFSRVDGC